MITSEPLHPSLTAMEGECALQFYSKVYALLEQEETKLWHFSPLTLFNMFDEEQKTGSFELPEEV